MGYLSQARQLQSLRSQSSSSKSGGGGGFFGIHMPDLGVGNLLHDIFVGLPSGVARAAGEASTGDWSGFGDIGKGMASSFVGTGLSAVDLATLGKAHGFTDPLREDWADIFGGEQFKPRTLSEQYNDRGLAPMLAENVGNVAIGAGAAGKLLKLSDVGKVAEAGLAGERAARAGATAEDLSRAAGVAKESGVGRFKAAGITGDLKAAGKAMARAEGIDSAALDAAKVAKRARTLETLHAFEHPYRSLYRGARNLGRAGTARMMGDTVPEALPTEEAVAGAEAAPPPEPALVGAQAGSEPGGYGGASPDLQAALADAVAHVNNPEVQAAQAAQDAAVIDTRRELAWQAHQGEQPVTLYRGQAPGNDPAGLFWSTDLAEAQSHAAATGGTVLETTVPKSVADEASARALAGGHFGTTGQTGVVHDLDPYWADLAKPVEAASSQSPLEGPVTAAAAEGSQTPGAFTDDAARDYARAHGLPEPTPVDTTAQVNPVRGRIVSAMYEGAKSTPDSPEVVAAYNAFAKETVQQYQFLKDQGIRLEFVDRPESGGIYANEQELFADIQRGVMKVDRTGAGEEHLVPAMNEVIDVDVNGNPVTVNDAFRAVHDYFGHSRAGNLFDRHGEDVAWRLHSQMYSPEAQKALFTETVGQNSYLNFSPKNVAAKAAGGIPQFPEQKATLLPETVRSLDFNPPTDQPIEVQLRVAAAEPISQWATKLVDSMPEPAVRSLAKVDRFLTARQVGMVIKERIRAQEIDRRRHLESEVIKPLRDAGAEFLVGKELPNGTRITPELADDLIGDHLMARLNLVEALEAAAETMPNATEEGMAAFRNVLEDINARSADQIPKEWLQDTDGNPTPLGEAMDEGVAQLRSAEQTRLDVLTGTRKGTKGLEGVGATLPSLSVGAQRLLKEAATLFDQARKLEETRIPRERAAAMRDIAHIGDEISATGAKIKAAEDAGRSALRDFDLSRGADLPRVMHNPETWASAVDDIVSRTLERGGASYDPRAGRMLEPKGQGGQDVGFATGAVPGTVRTVELTGTPQTNAELIATAVDEASRAYQDLFRSPNVIVGTWTENGRVHVDVSEIVQSRDEALVKAAARQQEAVYDLSKPVDHPEAFPVPPSRPDVAAKFLRRNRHRTRFATQLRSTFDRINAIRAKNGLDPLVRPEDIDAQMAVNDLIAVTQARSQPGRFKHPDMVYATMEARFRRQSAQLKDNPAALLELALGKGLHPETLRHAAEVVDNLDKVSRWYHRTNDIIRRRYSRPDGTPLRMILGNGKEADVADVLFQLIAATSIQQTPGMNLADALNAIGNYGKISNEYEQAGKFWTELMDEFLRTPARGKPGEFGATSPRTLSDLFEKVTKNDPHNVHRYWTARFPVLEILNGNTLDTWGEASGPLPDFESRFAQLTDELRAATPAEHQHLIDAAVAGEITPDEAATALRKVVPKEAKELLLGSGDTWRVRVSQHQRYGRGEVPYVEARQELSGSIPKEMPRDVALQNIDPKIIARLGEDRAVMEYYGQLAWAKVRSFYDNLKNPTTSDHVTLDMWMARLLGMDRKLDLMKPGEYLRVAEEVRSLNDAMGEILGRKVQPHETQAVLWAYAMVETQKELERAYAAGELPKPPKAMDWRDFADHLENPAARLSRAIDHADGQGIFFDRMKEDILGAMIAGGGQGNRNLMLFFRKADPVTLVHENAHAIRQILSPEDMAVFERAYGVKGGKWLTKHEEQFAHDFETYLSTGSAPTEGLTRYFARIRSFLSEAWRIVRGGRSLDDEVRAVFDRMLDPTKEDIAAADVLPTGPIQRETFIEGAGERIARSPRERSRLNLDIPELGTGDAYRRGLRGGEALAVRDAAEAQLRELQARQARLQSNLDKMKRSIYEHTLPSELAKQRLVSRAERKLERVAKQMEHPNLSNVPPSWKPAYGALLKLHKEAEGIPELAAILEDMQPTWDTMLRLAAQNGFDPTHIRSFSPTEVRQLVYSTVQLGKKGRDLGQTLEAGTRKVRRGAQSRTRSLDALAAAYIEATHEQHTNALADYIEQTWARPVPKEGIPDKRYVGWDAERAFLQTGERTKEGNIQVEGVSAAPTKMIPREVKAVLDAYQRDFHHGFFNALATVTDPWRLFILTLSPRWYVNNILGNVFLATKEGVNLGDWARSWQTIHPGGKISSRLAKYAPLPEELVGEARAAVAGGIGTDLGGGATSLVEYPKGVQGISMMREEHGTVAALKLAQRRLAKGNEVVDEMARIATYYAGRRKGMTSTEALHRTFKVLVDYNDLSPLERQFVRSVVPFYAWQKGMLKMAAKFAIDNPKVVPILLSLDRMNKEHAAEQYGGEVPEYYESVVPLPGVGNINLKNVNPLTDSAALATPEGIASAMNPFVAIGIRNAFGAPEGGFVTHQRINEFGMAVPTTSPAAELGGVFTGLPQARLFEGDKSLLQRGGQFAGAPIYTEADMQRIIDRILKSQKKIETGARY